MSGFNPLLIITRITSNVVSSVNIQNTSSNSAQNASLGLSSDMNTFSGNFQAGQSNSGTSGLYFKPTPLILSPSSELKLTTIEIDKKANYAKDLLNLPRDFSELIDQITSTAKQPAAYNQQIDRAIYSIFQNGRIDLSNLSILLKENSKEAMQKLMMVIANVSKYGANDVSGLKEMLNLFASQTAFANDSQALKTLILLYLPWLPLSARSENNLDFTIDIFDKIQGPDPDSEETVETVKILIETNNFSNVTVTVEMNPIGQMDIDVAAGENFPHKKAMELIKEASSMNNIKSNISADVSKSIEKQGLNYPSGKVKITSSGSISPKMMLMAQLLIKIIIQLDYDETIIKRNNECSQ